MRNITLYTTAILLAIASGTAVLRAQDAELPTMAEPAPLCKEAELRQKLGSCFKSIDGAVDCLSSPTHQEGASKSTIMCFCISTNAELKECLGQSDLNSESFSAPTITKHACVQWWYLVSFSVCVCVCVCVCECVCVGEEC